MQKKSFIFYEDWAKVLRGLPEDVQGELFRAIVDYGIDGKLSELKPMAGAVFGFIKLQIDRDRPRNIGKEHWNWKGGITSLNSAIRNSAQTKQWRKKVFERDKYICQKCKKKGGVLHAHHIKQFSLFPEMRFDIDNGVTLCKKCHNKIHSK
jgi:5-methylcytosine-specific restriction endonuclease McrA